MKRILLSLALIAAMKFELIVADIKGAYLQTSELGRLLFAKPPKEGWAPGWPA